MPVDVILPKMSTTMDMGTIVRWLKSEGDAVHEGEVLFELETDKALVEVEATAGGILGGILFAAGSTLPTGQVVGYILGPGEALPTTPQLTSPQPKVEATGLGEPVGAAIPAERHKASPVAKRIAQEFGIDLVGITGSGPDGRITREDVQAAVRERDAGVKGAHKQEQVTASLPTHTLQPLNPAPVRMSGPSEGPRLEMSGVRRVIFERMANSAHTVARVTLLTEADATQLVEWRVRLKERQAVSPLPTYTDLVVLLAAKALRQYPYMNIRLLESKIQRLDAIHIGIAIETDRGLLVPVIRDADKKGLEELTGETLRLVEKTRAGMATPYELTGGTFTITNLGMFDVDGFTPIINLPECAILGLGRIMQKPAVFKGAVAVRELMTLSLSFDHRLVDGAPAARFLQSIKDLIEEPLFGC